MKLFHPPPTLTKSILPPAPENVPAAEGEDLEGSALELPPRGRVPLDSRLFKGVEGWGSSLYRLVTSCLADTSFVVDRPPAHFFVKKKFSSTSGVGTVTQKVPSVFCYAHTFCGEGERCATLGGFIPSLCEITSGLLLRSHSLRRGNAVLRTESPSQGYRLTAASLPCPGRSFGTSNKGAEPTLYVHRRLVRS